MGRQIGIGEEDQLSFLWFASSKVQHRSVIMELFPKYLLDACINGS